MAALLRLILPVTLDAVIRLLRMVMRCFFLMRRVSMILGLEVLSLVCGTFAILGHEFSKIRELSLDYKLKPVANDRL